MAHPVPDHKFPKVSATQCSCCRQPLTSGQGFDVPFIGVVGPQCVKKYAALVSVLQAADGLTIHNGAGAEIYRAVERVRYILQQQLGYEVEIKFSPNRQMATVHIGARTRRPNGVIKSFRERRAEFEAQLKIAQGDNGMQWTEWVAA